MSQLICLSLRRSCGKNWSPEADRKAEPPDEVKSKGSSSSVHDEGDEFKRSMGEKALKEEAKSIQHMLTHIPKNPYCDICQHAKMFNPPWRTVGASTKVDAEKFGDRITADFRITRGEEEEKEEEEEVGIDDKRSALVVKDVATGFMYVYPNARRTTNAAVLAMKHLVRHKDEGAFYSDNAPELISAMKVLRWRHVLSRGYVSKSNAQAERAVRSVLRYPSSSLASRIEPLALATCRQTLVFYAKCPVSGG